MVQVIYLVAVQAAQVVQVIYLVAVQAAGGPGDFGNPPGGTGIELGGPGYFDGPMEFGDPTIGMPGGEGLGGNFNTGPSGFVPNQFMGAQPPGAASFAPLGQPTNFVFGPDPIGQANMGFSGGGYGPGGPAAFDGGPGGFAGGPGGFAGGLEVLLVDLEVLLVDLAEVLLVDLEVLLVDLEVLLVDLAEVLLVVLEDMEDQVALLGVPRLVLDLDQLWGDLEVNHILNNFMMIHLCTVIIILVVPLVV